MEFAPDNRIAQDHLGIGTTLPRNAISSKLPQKLESGFIELATGRGEFELKASAPRFFHSICDRIRISAALQFARGEFAPRIQMQCKPGRKAARESRLRHEM
ncbi:hypothetical protein, partial [Streptomyces sp. NPDC002324]